MTKKKVEPNVFESFVPAHEMPNCPLCKKPIMVPPKTHADTLMVFHAHGRAALAHDGCRPAEGSKPPPEKRWGYCDRCHSQVEFIGDKKARACGMGKKCEAWV